MKITVNNQTWKIKEVPYESGKLVVNGTFRQGTTHFHTQTIYLSNDLLEDRKREVLLHELTHCFLYATQAYVDKENFTEEEVCEFVALYGAKVTDIMRKYFEEEKERK